MCVNKLRTLFHLAHCRSGGSHSMRLNEGEHMLVGACLGSTKVKAHLHLSHVETTHTRSQINEGMG